MKSATAGLIGLAIAAASVEGRLHKQHARGLRPHTHHIKRADNVQPGVAYEALVGYGYQSGQEGACGQVSQDSDFVAGLSTLTYGSDVCGQCIQITSSDSDNTVVASIEDSCTPAGDGDLCHGYYDLYLSTAAFKKLAGDNLDAGLVNATWQLTDCPTDSSSQSSYAPVESETKRFSAAAQSVVDQAKSQEAASNTQQAYQAPAQSANSQSSQALKKQAAFQQNTKAAEQTNTWDQSSDAAPTKSNTWEQAAYAAPAQSNTWDDSSDAAPTDSNTWDDSADAAPTDSNTWDDSAEPTSAESSSAPAAASSASTNQNKGGWPSTKFGVAWGVDNSLASALNGGVISSYMHWKDGPVDGLDAMYMPMLERSEDSYGEIFNGVIAGLSSPPSVILGQNEIDVSTTYSDASTAADYYRRYITPHCSDASLCCTPSITYHIDQLKEFMDACPDCGINCVQLHIYRPVTDDMAQDAQAWVEEAYNTLGQLPVVISEAGIDTRNGAASDSQVVQFMKDMSSWAYNKDWVVAVQWSGGFEASSPWDGFLSAANALLSGSGLSWPGQCWKSNNFD